MNLIRVAAEWLDERTGWRSVKAALLDRHVPKINWWYTLGSAALAVLLVQAATGILLAMNYSADPERAHDSIRFIMERVPFGPLLRGIHHWGATAMVVLVSLHLMRTLAMAAYKRPRELTWLVGVALFGITLGFGFTGYLLPWDQKAYWATQVGVNVAGQVPVLGDFLAKVMRGGDDLGAVTLARFYALHVLVLPASIIAVLGLHLYLVVWHGISSRPNADADREAAKDPAGAWPRIKAAYAAEKSAGDSFHPYATVKDTIVATVIIAALAALAISQGTALEETADPTDATYNPRPEWYFLFLFQALKYFPGHLEAVAAVVLPGLGMALLLGLPFLDRSPFRTLRRRPLVAAVAGVALAGIGYLTFEGARSPITNPRMSDNPLAVEGKRLVEQLKCAHCHPIRGRGGKVGPELATAAGRHDADWLKRHFSNPKALVPGSEMPPFALLPDEADAVVAYLVEMQGPGEYSAKAPGLFTEHCATCHKIAGKGEDSAPDLSGVGAYRTAPWLTAYIADPSSANPDAVMPGFRGQLTDAEISDLARYLAVQKAGAESK